MKRFFTIILCSLMAGIAMAQPRKYTADYKSPTTPDGPIIVAYVTADESAELPDPFSMTHINYAFGHVNDTFNGVRISNPERLHRISALKQQNPNLKVMLSIGGWGSGRFSEMAEDPQLRKAFAKDCARVMKEFNLDGIDIDWEYPSQGAGAGISESAADTHNYTLMMMDLRKALGKKALLTLASSQSARYIDFPAIIPYISFVNVMTYDMGTPPNGLHNALYASRRAGRNNTVLGMERHMKVGIPKTMLTVGVPFYGRGARERGGLAIGTDPSTANPQSGAAPVAQPRQYAPIKDYLNYHELVQLLANDGQGLKEQGLEMGWDDEAKVPYITRNGTVVYTIENPESLKLKCDYIRREGFLGAMYWEYSCDDAQGTLRNIVRDAFLK